MVQFLARWNGEDVPVTLDKTPVVLTTGPQRTEEGWHEDTKTFTREDDRQESDGEDCDGRLAKHYRFVCPIDRLHASSYEGRLYPEWVVVKSWQRDYRAEAAGY